MTIVDGYYDLEIAGWLHSIYIFLLDHSSGRHSSRHPVQTTTPFSCIVQLWTWCRGGKETELNDEGYTVVVLALA